MSQEVSHTRMIHPSSIAIVLVLMGITALFLAMSVAYVYTRVNAALPAVQLPIIFYFNTLILMASSFFIWKAGPAFENQSYGVMMRFLILCLVATITFLLLQWSSWNWMMENNMPMQRDASHGYLYAISILHFAHVIFGIPFLANYMWKMWNENQKDDSLFFIEEKPKRRLRLISTYWHFIDILWIYLVVFFAVNSFL